MKPIVKKMWTCSDRDGIVKVPDNYQQNTTVYACSKRQRKTCREEHGRVLMHCRPITITITDGHGEESC
jgi:hypothetical protein